MLWRYSIMLVVIGCAAPLFSAQPELPKKPARPQPEKSPLVARLVANETTYTLPADRQGNEAAERLKSPTLKDLPEPPAVDLVLELKNPTDAPIAIMIESDSGGLDLALEGKGAVTVEPKRAFTREFRIGKKIEIAPGKTYEIPIKQLKYGFRGVGTHAYWTEPGEYRLAAAFRWPSPTADAGPAPVIFQAVADPVTLSVKGQ